MLVRSRIALLGAAAALATAVLAGSALGSAKATKLSGTVGPGFTITLKNSSGKPVKKLKSGRYTISVSDKSPIHNFHLSGPGVDKEITSVPFTGTKKITVRL
jgi:hypothetical protein